MKRLMKNWIMNNVGFIFVACVVILIVTVILVCVLTSNYISSSVSSMEGGIIVEKHITERHIEQKMTYNPVFKSYLPTSVTVPASYILIVQKEVEGEIVTRKIEVTESRYQASEVGSVFVK